MKRFFKKLFSRFSFVALTIILMFVVFVFALVGGVYLAVLAVDHYFPSVAVYINYSLFFADWIIIFVTVVLIINRDMLPEAKLPWIACVVFLNLLGVATYIVFSHNRPTRWQRRKYEALSRHSAAYMRRALSEEQVSNLFCDKAGVSEALYKDNAAAVAYCGTKTQYFATGEAFFEAMMTDIQEAKQYIFLEFFIIGKGKLWSRLLSVLTQKVKEGVEVRVIYDDIGSMSRVHVGYRKTLERMGIGCVKFNPFVPVVTNVHNFRDHRKIVVVDGRVGYTGGANLADEYVNYTSPYGYWKDNAVRLEGEGVKSLILLFLQMYNARRRTTDDFSVYIPERYEAFDGAGAVQVYGDGPRPIYDRQVGEDVYLNILAAARKYVFITTPYLIIDTRMREAIVLASKRGVDVRIVVPHTPDKKLAFQLTRSNYLPLIRAGVKIYEYLPGFIHAKSFLSDDEIGVVGTINLDYRSLMHHYEDAVLMYRTEALDGLKEDMIKTFSVCVLQTEESAKKNVVARVLCEIAKVFAPLF